MNKPAALIAATLLLCSFSPAQKKAPLKPVRFQGAPQYTQEELLAAAGLKPGARLSPIELKTHAKQLSDTGFFSLVKFASDSKGFLFTLTPAPSGQLYPMHLDNLPLTPGKELDDQLHQRFPLYHGLLPATGTTLEAICQAFEEMLAAKGAKTTVSAALTSGLGPKKITAINFSITSPAVQIGPIRLSGVSADMLAKADTLASSQEGNPYDTENSAKGLEHIFEDLYQDQDYAAVEVSVSQIDPQIVTDRSSDPTIEVPFAVAIREGGIYKLGRIDYPAGALAPRAEVEKIVSKAQAGSGRPLDLFVLAVGDAYHARGYLDCSINVQPSFNEATRIVNYSLDIAPGELYRMGAVHFDGAPDAMVARLTRLWKMARGDVFDESYVSTFASRAQKQDRTLAKWMQTVVTTHNVKSDPVTHTVNCIFLFAKTAGSGR